MPMNPFENYTPPAVEDILSDYYMPRTREDILSDHPPFRHDVLILKQQAIIQEGFQAIVQSSQEQIDLFLSGRDGFEYSRPVQDLQRFGQFKTPGNLLNFVTQSILLGIASGMSERGIELDREADVTPDYEDDTPDSIPTVRVKVTFVED